MGYVYEKQAILEYIKKTGLQSGGKAKCPVAGTNHDIAAAGLKAATAVTREVKRRNMQGKNKRKSRGAEDLIDSDDDDDTLTLR
jgi:hypothetical protein